MKRYVYLQQMKHFQHKEKNKFAIVSSSPISAASFTSKLDLLHSLEKGISLHFFLISYPESFFIYV